MRTRNPVAVQSPEQVQPVGENNRIMETDFGFTGTVPSWIFLRKNALTQEQKPPLRLLLGSDAYNGAEKNDLARLEEARAWKELSLSTDF